ncbi:MAG: hypothetical protein LBV08_03055, partial [Clostridiales bacterium]|nr:hypothetical protein [Clostridiales bacterium]
MVDKKKIVTMAKLAVYDKKYSYKDDKVTEYFRHDYVYKQNSWDRFFVVLGGLIILLFLYGQRVFSDRPDALKFDFNGELRFIIIFFAVLLIFYTFIGSIK